MSLRKKTLSGVKWNFTGNILNQFTTFVVGVFLARMLSPNEYGLIGMTTVFIVVAETFVDSGFSQALIRKKDCSDSDYSTAFFFNIFTAIIVYLILYGLAEFVSEFYNEKKLTNIIRIVSLGVIINSTVIVQKTILIKNINFKTQTRISVVSTVISGFIGLIMAYKGYGVWSLVFKTLSAYVISSILFWLLNNWHPKLVFSKDSFKELFSFGTKILASNLIDRIYWNIYYFIIGKYYSTDILGQYTRAEMFKNLPSQNFTSIIANVSYPALSHISGDVEKLKKNFREVLSLTFFISTVLLGILFSTSDNLIVLLIGKQWSESIQMIKILTISAVPFSASVLCTLLFKLMNAPNLILKLEFYKKAFAIPTVLVGIFYGFYYMLYFLVVSAMADWLINSIYGGKLISYSLKSQIKDIGPSLIIISIVSYVVFKVDFFLKFDLVVNLLIQNFIYFFLLIFICELFKLEPYLSLKEKVTSFLKKI